MRLVVHRGVQYDADHLPSRIDASQIMPLEEWLESNRDPARSASTADEADPAPAKRSSRRRGGNG